MLLMLACLDLCHLAAMLELQELNEAGFAYHPLSWLHCCSATHCCGGCQWRRLVVVVVVVLLTYGSAFDLKTGALALSLAEASRG
jgi:hypothetical protein